ncbi:MAG: LamG-like jellyroll fold domain-containing protein [Candidatus Paceibacterota bacterium]|jgi:prepilin-type N-terminal cleavage/methylation domain-containing protein|nr:prepilin-type N-terminal cleavage/methylation domain-containing protein [Candidatus Paceibacterota bacterium]MDD5555396.1 prepilin-type N-terminal cleavage/methylation domain-containing protein [Candidatus Paceibacterota bacterium]
MSNKSFTLIEILVVIVIIGIISAFIIVSMAGVSDKARIAKGQAFGNSLRNSLLLNLVSEWKFDGPTAVDSTATGDDLKDSWGTNNASVYGSPKVKGGTSCVSGKCLYFEQSSSDNLSRVDNITVSDISNNYTFSFWVNFNHGVRWNGGIFSNPSWGGLLQVLNQTSDAVIYLNMGSGAYNVQYYVYFNDETISRSISFDTIKDKWALIVLSYDGSYIRFYVDGKELSPYAKTGTLKTATSWRINFANITTYWTSGYMDDCKYFNSAISSSEVRQNYYSGLNRLLTNKEMEIEEFSLRLTELVGQP